MLATSTKICATKYTRRFLESVVSRYIIIRLKAEMFRHSNLRPYSRACSNDFEVVNQTEKVSIETFSQLMQAALRVAKQRHRDRVRREKLRHRVRTGRQYLQNMHDLYNNNEDARRPT
ncbi:uncharacterized protein LOC112460133 [Temnothorax curvispinosus]|uniref:Uncharacterized protein LOC112460133 n=1 Tax=Temnothorax curvispinosus TaxID=300111 RepID=A0A6J1QIK6_9HYME|nr:uncharacterized protein LOC112460133 [Temnothorax curvispinosus]